MSEVLPFDSLMNANQTANNEEGVLARFYEQPMQNKAKSLKEGRAIFDTQIYIEIRPAGQQKSIVKRKMKDSDKVAYPNYWAAFQKGEDVIAGTPIDEFRPLSKTRCAELKHIGINSIELLASINDDVFLNVGPDALDLKQSAQKYLDNQDDKDVELDSLKEQLAEMQETIKTMQDAQANPTPKKRGRPAKKVEDELTDNNTG